MTQQRAVAVGSQAGVMLLGSVFTLLVGLPFQIYVARVLGAENLGIFSLIEGVIFTLQAILAFGIPAILVKFIPQYLVSEDFQSIKRLLAKGAGILAVIGGGVYLLFLGSVPLLLRWWPDHQTTVLTAAIMGAVLPFGLMLSFFQQGLRAFQEINYMVLGSSVLQLSVKVLLTVAAFQLGFGLAGYVTALVLSVTFAVCFMAFGLLQKLRFLPESVSRPRPDHDRAWFRFSAIMYGHSLISSAGYIDRLIIGAAAGVAAVGTLAVVRQLLAIPSLFLQMLLAVGTPMFSTANTRMDRAEMQHVYNLITDWVVRVTFPLLVFFFVFADPLLQIYGKAFAEGGALVLRILVLSETMNLAFGPIGHVAWMCGLEKQNLYVSVAQLLVLVIMLLLLVPPFGLVGAAIGIWLTLLFQNIAEYRLTSRLLKLRWWDRRYVQWLAPGLATLCTALMLAVFVPHQSGWALAGSCLLLHVTFAAVSLAQGLNDDDLALLNYIFDLFVRPSIIKD